jgi:hypothetical protein
MAEYCPRCGNESLMFSNLHQIFGIEPWCMVCDGEEK